MDNLITQDRGLCQFLTFTGENPETNQNKVRRRLFYRNPSPLPKLEAAHRAFHAGCIQTQDPDLPLVWALKAGETQALHSLIDRHRVGLFRFIYRQIRNETDSLDLTIQAFARAYFNIDKFGPSAKFSTWLYHLALNLCRDHLKSRAHRNSFHTVSIDAFTQEEVEPSSFMSTRHSPDKEAEQLEVLRALETAINELPEHLKGPLVLKALENLSLADTAKLLGLSLNAVGMRIHRARKLLSEKMSKFGS